MKTSFYRSFIHFNSCWRLQSWTESETKLENPIFPKPLGPPKVLLIWNRFLISFYFLLNNEVYKKKEGLGIRLSLVLANFLQLKKLFRKYYPCFVTLKPTHWFSYVDDTFVLFPYRVNELQHFLPYLNSQHPNLKFTFEIEMKNEKKKSSYWCTSCQKSITFFILR